ncbi:hypothetical protein [Rahnella bruchi]|uniref:hypothetical protein n=1 Tax=Rahnella bruchi TaxID=1510573 RepID=UPI000EA36360|nr:hypothetical protein [Rahnella bruchi]
MKAHQFFWIVPALLAPAIGWSACQQDVVLYGQVSAVERQHSLWRIQQKNPYRADNMLRDAALNYAGSCQPAADLTVDFSLYGLFWSGWRPTGAFEQDDSHARFLADKLALTYAASDQLRLELGKLKAQGGLFYLKSPAALMNNYYAGFRSSRIYYPGVQPAYTASYWGGGITHDNEVRSLSLSVSPALSREGPYYQSSGNWRDAARSNSDERYLLSWSGREVADHTPTLNLMGGSNKSVAVADSYQFAPQWQFNAEAAWHWQQQWRHLDAQLADRLQGYSFPDQLYSREEQRNTELALGVQYTTDQFSQFGVEYYFQSAGYSVAEWRKQTDLIRFLNQRSGNAALDRLFDDYKFLMAGEINNTTNRGQLLGKHYLSTFNSILMADESVIQPYAIFNLGDYSTLVGVNYSKPVAAFDKKLAIYCGVYSAQGKQNSEFGLFGDTIGSWLGFKYQF